MCFHPDKCEVLSDTGSKRKHYHHRVHSAAWPDAQVSRQYSLLGQHRLTSDATCETHITNKASRTLGSEKNPQDRLLFSERQGLHGIRQTSNGDWNMQPLIQQCSLLTEICKLCLGPKQHQADNRLVCTTKGSTVDTAASEVRQDVQC